MIDKSGSPVGAPFLFGEQESLEGHFESCELPNVSKDTLRMYRPLYLN